MGSGFEVGRWGPSLKAQLPEFFQRNYPSCGLSSWDLFLQLLVSFPLVPDHENPGGKGRRSQETNDESANRSSRVEGQCSVPFCGLDAYFVPHRAISGGIRKPLGRFELGCWPS